METCLFIVVGVTTIANGLPVGELSELAEAVVEVTTVVLVTRSVLETISVLETTGDETEVEVEGLKVRVEIEKAGIELVEEGDEDVEVEVDEETDEEIDKLA